MLLFRTSMLFCPNGQKWRNPHTYLLQKSWMHIFAFDCCKWLKVCFFFIESAIRTGLFLSPCFTGWCSAYGRKLNELVESSGPIEQRRAVIADSCTVQVISSQGPHWCVLFLCHKVTSFWLLYGQTDWPEFLGLEFTGRDFPPLLTWNYVVKTAALTNLQQLLLISRNVSKLNSRTLGWFISKSPRQQLKPENRSFCVKLNSFIKVECRYYHYWTIP